MLIFQAISLVYNLSIILGALLVAKMLWKVLSAIIAIANKGKKR